MSCYDRYVCKHFIKLWLQSQLYTTHIPSSHLQFQSTLITVSKHTFHKNNPCDFCYIFAKFWTIFLKTYTVCTLLWKTFANNHQVVVFNETLCINWNLCSIRLILNTLLLNNYRSLYWMQNLEFESAPAISTIAVGDMNKYRKQLYRGPCYVVSGKVPCINFMSNHKNIVGSCIQRWCLIAMLD